ncbi:hypothetical protein [uncultured Roseibium sp.]|uniref:hypothetical protein n=1 Tax=uncultured Roseibium sp. TaxID=1936171 RepID=UPI0025932ACA|nr:hypothetical protein [uncultured Roseibium sp.]
MLDWLSKFFRDAVAVGHFAATSGFNHDGQEQEILFDQEALGTIAWRVAEAVSALLLRGYAKIIDLRKKFHTTGV